MECIGKGKLVFDGGEKKEFQALVKLDIASGMVIAKTLSIDPHLTDSVLSIGRCELTDFEAELLIGRISSRSLGAFKVVRLNQNFSVIDSSIVRALNIGGRGFGVMTLMLVSRSEVLQFYFEQKSEAGCELVFENAKIGALKLKEPNMNLKNNDDYLLVTGNGDLLSIRKELELAFSFLQGGRVVFRAGAFLSCMQLNVQKVYNGSNSYGAITNQENLKEEFLQKFLRYVLNMAEKERNKFNLFASYLLDACDQRIMLDNRYINLSIAIEIIDGARTMNAENLKRLLDIPKEDCRLIINVRNYLIHHGMYFQDAIKKAYEEVKNKNNGYQMPFNGDFDERMPGRFFFFVLTHVYKYVVREIGMKDFRISYENYLE